MVILQGVRHALWHRHRLLADARLLRLDDAAHARALRARRSLVNSRGVSARERGRVRGEHHRSGRSRSRGPPSQSAVVARCIRRRGSRVRFFLQWWFRIVLPCSIIYNNRLFKWVLNSVVGGRQDEGRFTLRTRTNERTNERTDGRVCLLRSMNVTTTKTTTTTTKTTAPTKGLVMRQTQDAVGQSACRALL